MNFYPKHYEGSHKFPSIVIAGWLCFQIAHEDARKGELDPTLYEHMFAMQTMLNPKDKDHTITNPMPSSFTKCGHNKILGRLCRSNSQNRPRLSNKGILKVSLISFGAALLLLYLLPVTLARYETSSFFPRLQYHKVIDSYII